MTNSGFDLSKYQEYIKNMEIERGFISNTVLQKCLLLGEEVGELFKAIRKSEIKNKSRDEIAFEVGEELVDILIYTCAIANRYDINLEEMFHKKEELNKTRSWN